MWRRSTVKTLLLQRCALRKFYVIWYGQNARYQIAFCVFHSFLVEVQTKCRTCAIATWRLVLWAPLVARNNHTQSAPEGSETTFICYRQSDSKKSYFCVTVQFNKKCWKNQHKTITPAISLSDVNFCIMFPILMQIDPLMGTAGTYFPSADRNCSKRKRDISVKKYILVRLFTIPISTAYISASFSNPLIFEIPKMGRRLRV